ILLERRIFLTSSYLAVLCNSRPSLTTKIMRRRDLSRRLRSWAARRIASFKTYASRGAVETSLDPAFGSPIEWPLMEGPPLKGPPSIGGPPSRPGRLMRFRLTGVTEDAAEKPDTCWTVAPYRYNATSSNSLKAPISAGSDSLTFFIVVEGISVAITTAAEIGKESLEKNFSCWRVPSS